MSGAQSWSVKGIDPKIREAAREAAARQGMSLGEYLNQALQNHPPATPLAPAAPPPRQRTPRLTPHPYDEEDDWNVAPPAPRASADPSRLSQRIESIERRTQLAVAGLDRAVSTLDRSLLGLAARVEEAEDISRESADRIAEALDQFRIAGDTLSGRLESAERQVGESRDALDGAKIELSVARERLENQVAAAEEVARKAEAAAQFLTTEMGNREAALGHKLGALEDQTREAIGGALAQARAAAEEASRQATEAASDAVSELRQLHARLADRLAESEEATRRAVEAAVKDTRAELDTRVATAESLKTEHAALISRIEKAEAHAREATAGLRQAAGAAIADLRNAQLSLAGRLKQVEERGGGADVSDLRAQQAEIAARLGALESRPSVESALAAFEKRLQEVAEATERKPGHDALAAFEQRLNEITARAADPEAREKLEEVGGAVKTLDANLQKLAERLAETESTANSAIRTLEETVSGLAARVDGVSATQETEALRSMLEHRLDEMAQSVSAMVGEARNEFAGQVGAVLEGAQGEGLEEALADVNRRLAAAERRQAQTIEAISVEIKRMSETVDRRLRAVEEHNDGAAAVAVREELARMSETLEARFEEIERREAAAFDRMGLEVGRLSERLEERVGAVETRSAQAIEHVGDQVARMAERFNQRHDVLARELGERMLDSEERSGARVAEAISSIMQRLGEVEERSAEAVAPVQKAVSSIASRLDGLSTEKESGHDIPTPARRFDDLVDSDDFGAPASISPPSFVTPSFNASPMDVAQPLRAAPLPPLTAPSFPSQHDDSDIYFAEDIEAEPAPEAAPAAPVELRAVAPEPPPEAAAQTFDDPFLEDADAFAPPPPEDDDPFWSPDAPEAASEAPPAADAAAFPLEESLPSALDEEPAALEAAPIPGRHDYLNAARKAAQAQSAATSKPGKAEPAAAPTYSLRGSSRIVLWGAASAITLLVAGGAWYLHAREQARHPATPIEPAPDVPAPTEALPPPAQTYEPSETTTDQAAPPASTTTSQAPASAQPTAAAPADGAPLAAAPQRAAAARANAVAAGPLPRRAAQSLEQAAQSGDLVAQYDLALQRLAANRTNDGIALLRRAADHGMPMAQYRLAKIYERGEGVPVDLAQARQWTERAAGGGNRRAMHDLGVYFARGEGAPQDEGAAFRWFRQAAELGVADSQYNLGVLYQQGRGVGASASEALFWFLVASHQGDSDAASRAAALEAQLTAAQVDQAHARADAFRPRAVSGPANGEFGPRPWDATAPARPGA